MHYQLEPNWQSVSSVLKSRLPVDQKDWLLDAGSLTAKLIQQCRQGRFHVEVLNQAWTRPLYTEASLLGMARGELAFTRQVRLMCNDDQWVFARTLIPSGSFTGKARQLGRLKNKPLGAVLFSDPATERIDMQVAKIKPAHKLFQLTLEDEASDVVELWGRRTLFSYAGKRLLVNEIFLPSIHGVSD